MHLVCRRNNKVFQFFAFIDQLKWKNWEQFFGKRYFPELATVYEKRLSTLSLNMRRILKKILLLWWILNIFSREFFFTRVYKNLKSSKYDMHFTELLNYFKTRENLVFCWGKKQNFILSWRPAKNKIYNN